MAMIGLTHQEADAFSLGRALRALAFPQNSEYRRDAEFEFDVSVETQKVEKRDVAGLMIPDDVLHHKMSTRALTAGTNTAGGHTIDDEMQSLIDIFLEHTFAADNVTVMSGLQGNVTIPGQDDRIVAAWTGEQGPAVAEDEPSFRTITLTPKTCRTWLRVTRQLLVQAHFSVEMFLRRDISRAIAKAVDAAILYGVGTAPAVADSDPDTPGNQPKAATFQPLGITETASIHKFTWRDTKTNRANDLIDRCLEMEEAIAASNVPAENCKFLLSNKLKRLMRQIQFFGKNEDNTWDNEIPLLSDENMILDYEASFSTQVESNDFFFCNWKDALLGLWGGLSILENPYSEDKEGIVRFTAENMVDVSVRYPVAMCFATKV